MKKYQWLTLALTLVAVVTLGFAQSRREEKPAQPSINETQAPPSMRERINRERLTALLSVVGISVEESTLLTESQASQEMQIRWDASVDASAQEDVALMKQDSPSRVLTVVERRKWNRPVARQRSSELSANQVLVAAVNGREQLRWWSLIPDPRIIRAEFPDAEGRLSGQVLYQSKGEFIVAFPDDPTITEVRLYHPQWTGSEFTLEPLAVIPVQ